MSSSLDSTCSDDDKNDSDWIDICNIKEKDENIGIGRMTFQNAAQGKRNSKEVRKKNYIYKQRMHEKRLQSIKESISVPDGKLNRALRILESKRKPIKNALFTARNSCQSRIIVHRNPTEKSYAFNENTFRRMACELSVCLQNQDWFNFARLISLMCDEATDTTERTILLKYALVALLYDPVALELNLFDMFLRGVCECDNDEKCDKFWKQISEIPTRARMKKPKQETSEDELSSDDEYGSKSIIDSLLNSDIHNFRWIKSNRAK